MTKYKLVATAAAGLKLLLVRITQHKVMRFKVKRKSFFEGDVTMCPHQYLASYSRSYQNHYGTIHCKSIRLALWTNKGDSLGENSSSRYRIPDSWKSVKSTLHSVPNCQSIVKKAIVNRLSRAYHDVLTCLQDRCPLSPIEVAILKMLLPRSIQVNASSNVVTVLSGAP